MLHSKYQNFLNFLNLVLKTFFVFLIYFYRTGMKPFMSGSPSCRFHPSCSEYSKVAFEDHGPFKAFLLTLKRLFKCNPLGPYGYDPVPHSTYGENV